MEHAAEHLEHVEHQQHAAHSPFDRRVAMTMAIVASLLAACTLLGHRAHNETVLQKTEASNRWAYYQAKNIRSHEYEAFLMLLDSISSQGLNDEGAKKAQAKWTSQVDKYKNELPEMMNVAKGHEDASHTAHAKGARFDLGELFLQLSLILSSIAILTKRVAFWLGGIASGVVGIGIAVSAFLVTGGHH